MTDKLTQLKHIEKLLVGVDKDDNDDNDTLYEIDARAWCYDNDHIFICFGKDKFNNGYMDYVDNGAQKEVRLWRTSYKAADRPRYTRSIDAQAAIMPDGWIDLTGDDRLGYRCFFHKLKGEIVGSETRSPTKPLAHFLAIVRIWI